MKLFRILILAALFAALFVLVGAVSADATDAFTNTVTVVSDTPDPNKETNASSITSPVAGSADHPPD